MSKKELLELFKKYGCDMGIWHGVPESSWDELAEDIFKFFNPQITWEEVDPIKWGGLNRENQLAEVEVVTKLKPLAVVKK